MTIATTVVLAVNFETIENSCPHSSGLWCVWRAMPDTKRPSKFKKFPMNATGGPVSSTLPGEWLSYDAAKAAYLTGGFDGVGLLMGSVSGVVGIDLDGVTDAAGGVVEGKAELVSQFVAIGGYIERSPSGYGLRQFVQGSVPDGYVTNNGAGVEVYDGVEPRFLTVTGQRWGGADHDVEAGNQGALETFVHAWMKPKPVSVTKATRGRGITGKARTDDEVIGLLLGRHDRDGQYQAIYSGQTEGKSECRGLP